MDKSTGYLSEPARKFFLCVAVMIETERTDAEFRKKIKVLFELYERELKIEEAGAMANKVFERVIERVRARK